MTKRIKQLSIFCNFFLSDSSKEISSIAIEIDEDSIKDIAKDDYSILAYMKMTAFQQLRKSSEKFESITSNAPTDLLAGDFPEIKIDSMNFGIYATFVGVDEKLDMQLVVEKEEKDQKGNIIRIMTAHEMIVLAALNCMSMLASVEFAVNDIINYEQTLEFHDQGQGEQTPDIT
jgi:hypothetical protein